MLVSLSIRDFVIVDTLELEFASGFTVLTGETGAGKSILIDALQLALGERGEADVVREGATRADIAAEFRTSAPVERWLAERELTGDSAGLVLVRRTVDANGRSRAFINGAAVTLGQLRELGEQLVDVHGQHAHQSLLRPAAQLDLLDEHGALGDQRRSVAAAYAEWKREQRARADAEAMAASATAEQERLRWLVDELETLAPVAGEWEQVEAEHKRLTHAAGLLEGAQAAINALNEADDSALAQIGTSGSRLTQLSAFDDRLKPVVELLETAQVQLDEAVTELQRYVDRADLDATRLADVEARVSALHAAARRLRCSPGDLAGLLADSRAKLTALTASADLAGLKAREMAAQQRYDKAASALSKARRAAARQMSTEVTRAMQDLAMPGGRFEVHLTDAEPAPAGNEKAEFLVAAHAGVAVKPLLRVASGGELARISLAIAVIAASATPVPTLIFDEVDAGIGGAVADTVGRLLKQLGQSRQVLCVTHLPQVAARGDQHCAVTKESTADGRPVSHIGVLERRARVEELARMLGGQEITETTRKHAREMLAG
ncbi:MAG TPA: DNA repair protein RecN [Burkholderiaceae bacterium]|nr:DNA repair protein RecN [Burkholderiaceae bacterium]